MAAIDAAARSNGPSISSAHPAPASTAANAGAVGAPSHPSSSAAEGARVLSGSSSAANGVRNEGINEKKSVAAVVDTNASGAVWINGRRVSAVTHGSGSGGVDAVGLPPAVDTSGTRFNGNSRSYTSGGEGLAAGALRGAATGPSAIGGERKGAAKLGDDANNGVLVATAADGNGGAVVADAGREVATAREVGADRLSSASTISGGAAAADRASVGDVNGRGDIVSKLEGRASVDEAAESSNVGSKEDAGKMVNGDVREEYGKLSPPASMAEVRTG